MPHSTVCQARVGPEKTPGNMIQGSSHDNRQVNNTQAVMFVECHRRPKSAL